VIALPQSSDPAESRPAHSPPDPPCASVQRSPAPIRPLSVLPAQDRRLKRSEEARLRAEKAADEAKAELARLTRLVAAGQFASWIAHEINQPIGAVVTNGEAALRWLDRDTPDLPEARAAIARALRDAGRAAAVVSGARAMLAKDTPAFSDVDLNQIVEDVVGLTEGAQVKLKVTVKMDLLSNLPLVKGDAIQLQQVLLNLVLNGMDAMKGVRNRPRELILRSGVLESGDVVMAVEDRGHGVKPADAGRLFDHFFTTKADGIGLGLPISRAIVVAHGGRLWATPVPGASPVKGAVFQFSLPRAAALAAGRPCASAATPAAKSDAALKSPSRRPLAARNACEREAVG
jgi:C4-dicarboxylate-specific signal transduction histidine kinase